MSKQIYITMVLLVAVVFAAGIILGRGLSNSSLTNVQKIINDNELTTESFIVEQQLIGILGGSCELARVRLSELSQEIWGLGKLLDSPTAEQDLGADQYNLLKRRYHLMQIKTYSLYRKLESDCNISSNVILFYFQQNQTESSEQGAVLDRLVKSYPVTVFAIEYNYSPELRFLEEYYGINSSPSLVINYGGILRNLASYEQLEAMIREGK
jgi:hypothetical protein